MRRVVPSSLLLLALVACGPRAAGPTSASPATTGPAAMAMRMQAPPEPTDPVLLEGKRTFDQVCSACHTMEPPPNLAPPIRMVSRHLRQAFPGEEEAVAHVLAYLPAPDSARAVMPAHAIERFGLMPPQPLPADVLEGVARYVWSLGEGMGEMGGGRGMGMGMGMRQRGMGARMRHRGGH